MDQHPHHERVPAGRNSLPVPQLVDSHRRHQFAGALNLHAVITDPKTGKPLKDVKTGFNGACRRAGIQNFRFHNLRHTFASHLVMKGIDLATVKVLLGHKTLAMPLRYAHLAPSHKAKAVDILANAMRKTG